MYLSKFGEKCNSDTFYLRVKISWRTGPRCRTKERRRFRDPGTVSSYVTTRQKKTLLYPGPDGGSTEVTRREPDKDTSANSTVKVKFWSHLSRIIHEKFKFLSTFPTSLDPFIWTESRPLNKTRTTKIWFDFYMSVCEWGPLHVS